MFISVFPYLSLSFQDVDFFTSQKVFVTEYQNVTGLLSQACLDDYPSMPHKCLVADVNARYGFRTPLFAWQSAFDRDQLTSSLDPPCNSSACADPYAANMTRSMTQNLWSGRIPYSPYSPTPTAPTALATSIVANTVVGHGGYLDACYRHCESPELRIAPTGGLTPLYALNEWYSAIVKGQGGDATANGSSPVIVKQAHGAFPCSSCCTTTRPV